MTIPACNNCGGPQGQLFFNNSYFCKNNCSQQTSKLDRLVVVKWFTWSRIPNLEGLRNRRGSEVFNELDLMRAYLRNFQGHSKLLPFYIWSTDIDDTRKIYQPPSSQAYYYADDKPFTIVSLVEEI